MSLSLAALTSSDQSLVETEIYVPLNMDKTPPFIIHSFFGVLCNFKDGQSCFIFTLKNTETIDVTKGGVQEKSSPHFRGTDCSLKPNKNMCCETDVIIHKEVDKTPHVKRGIYGPLIKRFMTQEL